jgi:predicted RNase H-like HicB family nuclease
MKRYLIVIEKGDSSYSAYSPDLPGSIAAGATIEETGNTMFEAIEFHLEGMKEDNITFPEPTAIAEYMAFRA